MATRTLFVALLFIHNPLAIAADPAIPDAAASIQERYQNAVTKITKQYETSVAEALSKFDGLIAKAKESGNLDAITALEREKERAASRDPTVGSLAADVVSVRKSCDAAIQNAHSLYDSSARELHANFVRDLSNLEKVETAANRFDSAKAVRTYRRQIEDAGPERYKRADSATSSYNARQKNECTIISGVLTARLVKTGVTYLEIDGKVYPATTTDTVKVFRWKATDEKVESIVSSDVKKADTAWLCINKSGRWVKLLVGFPKEDTVPVPKLTLPALVYESKKGDIGAVSGVVHQIMDKSNAVVGPSGSFIWVRGFSTENLRNDRESDFDGAIFKVVGNRQYRPKNRKPVTVPMIEPASKEEAAEVKKSAEVQLAKENESAKAIMQRNDELRKKAEQIFFPDQPAKP
jgi:hypothetical protein